MQNFSAHNKRIFRTYSDDLSILKPTFYTSAGKGGFYSKEFLGSTAAQMETGVGNEKITMQILNDRLATYLEKVRSLENTNSELELKICQFLEKKGPDAQDYSHYQVTLDKLRKEILEMTLSCAKVALQMDNAKLAAEDYRLKFEHELHLKQSVEADIHALRKMLDDTNLTRLHLENEVEALTGELINLKKHHQLEVLELHNQITQTGVQVDVDAPKGHDLTAIMEGMRAKYENITLKNQEELKAWHESKITEVQVQVTENTSALKEANTHVSKSRRKMQSLEIELQSVTGTRASLEEAIREMGLRYGMQVEQYNAIIVMREAELRQLRKDIQNQKQDYQALFNIKMKLEAEIATYRRLLDGEDIQFLTEEQNKIKVTTITQTLVDGKVVSTSSETKENTV
ncbi:keratin, type I cytoskeletal 18 [Myxocyprinus asiaticus]|uniref:keratin, type I cytoskeletal 18 n=1 Tax=Myxocyprinus asiaticus TaxID=70543 RepID=UPI0022227BB0|nr:keratin, type I cytoskeletal 18 [Myxocyprinus asiaticus]